MSKPTNYKQAFEAVLALAREAKPSKCKGDWWRALRDIEQLGEDFAPTAHQFFECACDDPLCHYCVGGLASCEVCGAAEGELTTECPGRQVPRKMREFVMNGEADFIGGEWVNTSDVKRVVNLARETADKAISKALGVLGKPEEMHGAGDGFGGSDY